VAHRDGDGFLLTDYHDQPLASGNASVEKVPLQLRDTCELWRSARQDEESQRQH
jgi:hypothetical protein